MDYHLVIVPHVRWDREGYARFEHLRRRLVLAIDDLLDTMEAPGGMPHFTLDGQTALALDYLAARPENHDRLLALVEAGRLDVGPWHVLPHPFLVSQESLVRNLARGLEDAGRLGSTAEPVAYLVDAFGCVGQMPQILQGFGMDAALVWRGVPAAVTRAEFWWQAPDGSRVLAVYAPFGCEPGKRLPLDVGRLAERLRRIIEAQAAWQSAPDVLVLAGGEHLFPPLELPAALERLLQRKLVAPSFVEGDSVQAGPEQHYTWEIGGLADYLERVRAGLDAGTLAVHVGELRDSRRAPLGVGLVSARIPAKVRDYEATRLMEARVEPLAAWCRLNGFAPDLRQHGRIWNLLLRSQGQPAIAGATHDDVQYDIDQRHHRAGQLMDLLVDEYLAALAARWPAPAPAAPALAQVAAFNPIGPRPAEICTGTVYTDARVQGAVLRDAHGAEVDVQLEYLGEDDLFTQAFTPEALLARLDPLRPLEPFMGLHTQRGHFRRHDEAAVLTLILGEQPNPGLDLLPAARAFLEAHPDVREVLLRYTRGHAHEITFAQQNVAPGQVSVFTLLRSGPDAGSEALTADDRMLTNAFYRLTWDGEALRLFDRRSGRRFGPLNIFSDAGDKGDLFDFCPLPADPPIDGPAAAKAEVIAAGPVYAAWRIRYQYDVPVRLAADRLHRHTETATLVLETVVKLYAGVDRVDFTTRLRNRMRDHRLRVGMLTPVETAQLWCDGHFELVRRPIALPPADKTWAELPQPTQPFNGFAALGDGQNTFLLMARGLREVEAVPDHADGGTALWLTLLRCVGDFARHDLETRPAGAVGPSLSVPDAQLPGVHTFDYSIAVLPEPVESASLWDRLAAYQTPSLVRQAAQPGDGSAVGTMAISDPDIEWSALKPAGVGHAVILRLVNKRAAPKPGVRFRSGEAVRAVYPADLAEAPAETALELAGGEVTLDFAPYEIRTLYLALRE
ncbi:MAG: hypothetical protein JXB47_03190 [Anaerolineae bacterium]|nr:hypothetical protein [Anaerolineae bacterium]